MTNQRIPERDVEGCAYSSATYGWPSGIIRQPSGNRGQLLAADGYEDEKNHDDEWRYPDMGHRYWTQYGNVFFRNMNANRDNQRAEHWFTDYYEEQP